MSIQQFNGEWVAAEDRVLFRFNTSENEEFNFWLTRRILQGLMQGTQHLAVKTLEKTHPPQVAQVVQEFQQQSVAQQVKFEDHYQSAAQKPLGDQPILVTGLVMNQDEQHTHVEFQLLTGKSVTLHLNAHVLQVMVTLLNKLQDTAAWGVGFGDTGAPALPAVGDVPRLVH